MQRREAYSLAMANGEDKNWRRLCSTLDGFFDRNGRWPVRVRIDPVLLDDLRGHLFTQASWARICQKLDFVTDTTVTVTAEDDRASFEYPGAGPSTLPRPSAQDWLGVEPDGLGRPALAMPALPSDPAALLAAARRALASAAVSDVKGMKAVAHASLPYDSETWTVCRAAQIPGCARLIDVAVELRARTDGAHGVVAILAPPDPVPKNAKLPDEVYVRRYQAAAWYGLGIVFAVDAPDGVPGTTWNPAAAPVRGDFDTLADAIEAKIHDDIGGWIPAEDSREVEGMVRVSVHLALAEHNFYRSLRSNDGPSGGKSYQGFWRRGEADGVWARSGPVPTRLALEVKMHEDIEAPFCQLLDDLGHSDAAINVRVADGKTIEYGAAKAAMAGLSQRLPVRYIEIE